MLDSNNPLTQFDLWYKEACKHPHIIEPNAMSLATATKDAAPSVRIVLMRGYSDLGFVFYTNLTSRKSNEIKANNQAALCFYWMPLRKQIRVTGTISKVTNEQADQYFATRPRESQISAWASKQSMHLDNYNSFIDRITKITNDFTNKEQIPRPPFWSGYILKPKQIEFWQEQKFRRHERHLYSYYANGWRSEMLYP
jgi:pyridoxamine 5'-phosphate oxidase